MVRTRDVYPIMNKENLIHGLTLHAVFLLTGFAKVSCLTNFILPEYELVVLQSHYFTGQIFPLFVFLAAGSEGLSY